MSAGDEQAADFLPTARRAMRMAVEAATNGDHDLSYLWINIARELRIGASPAIPVPRPLDRRTEALVERALTPLPARVTHLGNDALLPVCEEVGPEDPEGALVSFDRADVTCLDCLREPVAVEHVSVAATPVELHAAYEAGQIPVPAERPAWQRDETEVIRYEPFGEHDPARCGNCGHGIGLTFPDDGSEAVWKHLVTKQSVCPVSAPDQPHTFATPLLDSRG